MICNLSVWCAESILGQVCGEGNNTIAQIVFKSIHLKKSKGKARNFQQKKNGSKECEMKMKLKFWDEFLVKIEASSQLVPYLRRMKIMQRSNLHQ